MTLYDKIIKLYPTLTSADFMPITSTILLQNDSDGRGDYIKSWNHPTFTEPTADQLAALDAPAQPTPAVTPSTPVDTPAAQPAAQPTPAPAQPASAPTGV